MVNKTRPAKKVGKTQKKVPYGSGPIYYSSGELASSTALVTIPESSLAPVGAKYKTESVMGAECVVTLIENRATIGVVDSASCSFEREFYFGQEFIPLSRFESP